MHLKILILSCSASFKVFNRRRVLPGLGYMLFLSTVKFFLTSISFKALTVAGAIIGDGDCKRGVHAKPSKKTNVLFLAKIAPPSTSCTRAGTRTFAWGSVTRFKLGSGSTQRLDTCCQQKL